MTRDHVVPKSRGGTFIVPACGPCNKSKADSSLDKWLLRLPNSAPQHYIIPAFILWMQNNNIC